jgi:hypothetical protein
MITRVSLDLRAGAAPALLTPMHTELLFCCAGARGTLRSSRDGPSRLALVLAGTVTDAVGGSAGGALVPAAP